MIKHKKLILSSLGIASVLAVVPITVISCGNSSKNKLNTEKERLEKLVYTAKANNQILPSNINVNLENLLSFNIENLPTDDDVFTYYFAKSEVTQPNDLNGTITLTVTITLQAESQNNKTTAEILVAGFQTANQVNQDKLQKALDAAEIRLNASAATTLPSAASVDNVTLPLNTDDIAYSVTFKDQDNITGTLTANLVATGQNVLAGATAQKDFRLTEFQTTAQAQQQLDSFIDTLTSKDPDQRPRLGNGDILPSNLISSTWVDPNNPDTYNGGNGFNHIFGLVGLPSGAKFMLVFSDANDEAGTITFNYFVKKSNVDSKIVELPLEGLRTTAQQANQDILQAALDAADLITSALAATTLPSAATEASVNIPANTDTITYSVTFKSADDALGSVIATLKATGIGALAGTTVITRDFALTGFQTTAEQAQAQATLQAALDAAKLTTSASAATTLPSAASEANINLPANTDTITYSVTFKSADDSTGSVIATLKATGIGALAGTTPKTKEFNLTGFQTTVQAQDILQAALDAAKLTTSASAATTLPSAASEANINLPPNTDTITYSVSFSNHNDAAGSLIATLKATGIGALAGTNAVTKPISFNNFKSIFNTEIKSDGTIKITGPSSENLPNRNNLTIPPQVNGRNVTEIGDLAFSREGFSGTLEIPNSVTLIGAGAFSSNSFSGALIIHNSVISIGSDAFFGNQFSGTLIIPSSVTSIGVRAFFSNSFNALENNSNVSNSNAWYSN